MSELLELRQSHPELSLCAFSRMAGVQSWRLRDHQKRASARARREQDDQHRRERVREFALKHPTYGYRRLHREMRLTGEEVGLEHVRRTVKALGLERPRVKKTRKAPAVAAPPERWPPGRRVQVDATRLSLPDGVCWVYVVLDVLSRAALAVKAVRSLSMQLAREALLEGVRVLRSAGIEEEILVMSDGGSDFTSELFQAECRSLGSWVRAKVSQRGGMGILERANRTFKHEFAFREELKSLAGVREVCSRFQGWYNHERQHTAIGYVTPWSKLVESAETLLAA